VLVGGVVIGKYRPDQFFSRIKMKKNEEKFIPVPYINIVNWLFGY
jgi:hypothetical protein